MYIFLGRGRALDVDLTVYRQFQGIHSNKQIV
jgi:hypothetical protein